MNNSMSVIKTNDFSKDPLVSIVIVSYNSEGYLVDTLNSIKDQTYPNIELIVSDDCSTDDTVEVCKNWFEENRGRFTNTHIVTSPVNTGIAPNFNRGIRVATGEWIKTIGGDDALFPHLIDEYITYITNHPDAEFLHSKAINYLERFDEECKMYSEDNSMAKINKAGLSPNEQFNILLRSTIVAAPTVMIKSNVFKKVGLFDENYPMFEDTPMWLKITKNNIKLHFVNVMGAKYRVRKNSVIRTNTQGKFLTNFSMDRNKAFNEISLPYLPTYERVLKSIAFKLNNFFYGLNNNSFAVKIMYKITTLPLMFIIHKINKSYR